MPHPSTNQVKKKIIVLNGPPGVGKDTAASAICGYISKHAAFYHPRHMKMAEPLKKAAHALVDAFPSWDYYDLPEHAKEKDRPSGDFMGLTPRELYIKLSEGFCKSVFGDDFFGMIMRKRIHKAQGCQVVVISDAGFVDEIDNLIRYVSPENVLLLELYSDGKDFKDDSRGYIGEVLKEVHPKLTLKRLRNEFGDQADKELFRIYCQGAAKGWLKIEEKVGVL